MRGSKAGTIIVAIVVVILIGGGFWALSRTDRVGPDTTPPPSPTTVAPTPTTGTPTTAPDPAAVKNSQGETVLLVRISGCEGCQVGALRTLGGSGSWSATVSGGVAQLEMPTAATYGLVLGVTGASNDAADQPQTLVVLRPNGAKPGAAVSSSTAAAAGTGSYCWAGTTLDTAALRIRAEASGPTVSRAWADPALPTLGGSVPLRQGGAKVPAAPNCG